MAWLQHLIMVIQIGFPLNPFLINIEQVDLKAADQARVCEPPPSGRPWSTHLNHRNGFF